MCQEVLCTRPQRECIYMPLRAFTFLPSFSFSVCMWCIFCHLLVAFCPQLVPQSGVPEASCTEGQKNTIFFAEQTLLVLVFHENKNFEIELLKKACKCGILKYKSNNIGNTDPSNQFKKKFNLTNKILKKLANCVKSHFSRGVS